MTSRIGKTIGWLFMAALTLIGLVMGAFFLLQTDPRAGVEPESELLTVEGKLAWMETYKYGTRFGLVGVSEQFVYLSKPGGMRAVRDALKYAGEKPVLVRYEKESGGPRTSDQKYHDVWALSVGGKPVRTYAETVSGWESDNRLFPWLGLAMLGCGIYFGREALRARTEAQQGAPDDGPRPADSDRA